MLLGISLYLLYKNSRKIIQKKSANSIDFLNSVVITRSKESQLSKISKIMLLYFTRLNPVLWMQEATAWWLIGKSN